MVGERHPRVNEWVFVDSRKHGDWVKGQQNGHGVGEGGDAAYGATYRISASRQPISERELRRLRHFMVR